MNFTLAISVAFLATLGCSTPAHGPRRPAYIGGTADVSGRVPTLKLQFSGNPRLDLETPHFGCSGVLVDPRLILTAAHCARDPEHELGPGYALLISDARGTERRARISAVYYQPDLRRANQGISAAAAEAGRTRAHYPDIAVIEIADALDFPVVRVERGSLSEGEPLLLGGYGFDSDKPADPAEFSRSSLVLAQKPVARLTGFFGFFRQADPVSGKRSAVGSGDSGGPVYRIDAAGRPISVVGVNSYVDDTARRHVGPIHFGPEYDAFARLDAGASGIPGATWIREIVRHRVPPGP